MQIPGLEINVVPLSKSTTTIHCKMPNDSAINIQWTQIVALPNFALTDYASQGKTRPNNVVHLTHCQSHQSHYTCLSRSSTAAGTVIIQGFHEK